MSLTFGIECEVSSGSAGLLTALGLEGIHDYHCDCYDCDPWRSGPNFTMQEDCTADAEVISRVLTYGTPEADEAIDQLGEALRSARAGTTMGQGVHIHVNAADMTPADRARFWRLFLRYQYDLGDIAAGRFQEVRSYNQPVREDEIYSDASVFWGDDLDLAGKRLGSPYARTAWCNTHTGHGTFEFRLWNATRVTWRLHLYVGLSVALIAAAMDGVTVEQHDGRHLSAALGPYLTPTAYAALLRHYISKEQ